jgi:transcriptional regulator with XRE-family HTH domain
MKDDIPAKALGVAITIVRKRRGLSMTSLGRRMKITHSNISAWEAAISSPTWANLVAVCKALNIKLSDFMTVVEATMKAMENARHAAQSAPAADNPTGEGMGASGD